MLKLRNNSKGDSNLGSLDCESSIQPLCYRAPRVVSIAITRSCVVYLRLLFCTACLVYHTAVPYAMYQTLYPEFIVNNYCFDIKRAAATFAQFAVTIHGKHKYFFIKQTCVNYLHYSTTCVSKIEAVIIWPLTYFTTLTV